MSAFISDDFLLGSRTARRLYHDYAKAEPILDYHCHLDPADLAADRRYPNLVAPWINDPYKHRAMRMAGVPEEAITGATTDREKFERWAATVPRLVGNPLHHWTALELKRYFDIDEPLNPASASRIWEAGNARLATEGYSARGLLLKAGVECVCTSDRLLDPLEPHATLARTGASPRVLPSLRADDIVAVESLQFSGWLQQLAAVTGDEIRDYDGFRVAVGRRLDFFGAAGCRVSDHGLDDFDYDVVSDSDAALLFARHLGGESLAKGDIRRLRSGILRFLGAEYGRRGWILQLHVGALRRTSSRLRRLAGPAGGYSGAGPACNIAGLVAWLDDLEITGELPRTIVYPLNPVDFMPVAVLAGSFAEDGVPGKLQLGPAWWYNDHAVGIRAHLEAVTSHGLLSTFIGMTTDARSPLSMARQEYFRRVLCGWLGEQVELGALPGDFTELGELVRDVCGRNARRYLAL